MKINVTKEQWDSFIYNKANLVKFLKLNSYKGWPETFRDGKNHCLYFR